MNNDEEDDIIPNEDENENKEFADFQRRFYWTLPLTVVVFVLAMFGHRLALFDRGTQNWIELAVTLPVVLWAGWPFFTRGWRSIVTGKLNMFTLIAIGVGAAFLYSVVATFAPGLFPDTFRMHGGMVPVYYEAAGVVVALVLLGQVLELRARAATGKAIRALLNLAPKTARRINADGTETTLDIEPLAGRLACFRADVMEHEVLLAHKTRFSLTGWMLNQYHELTFL